MARYLSITIIIIYLFIYSGSSLMLGMTRQLMPIIQQCRVFLEGIYTTLCRFTLFFVPIRLLGA